MDIKALAELGRVSKDIKVSEKLNVKVHTLSVIEQQEALSAIPGGISADISKFPQMQHSVLVQATEEVNGEKINKEDAKKLYDVIQYSILAKIFTAYSQLTDEQDKILDDLKKK